MTVIAARRSELERIRARIEAADRRAFFALVRALHVIDLEFVVATTEKEIAHGSTMPWHLAGLRCARAELHRRTRGHLDLLDPLTCSRI